MLIKNKFHMGLGLPEGGIKQKKDNFINLGKKFNYFETIILSTDAELL